MTPAETRTIATIDSLLKSGSISAIKKAAMIIMQHSDLRMKEQAFQLCLNLRMRRWRELYDAIKIDIQRLDDGAGGRLYRMSELPDYRPWVDPSAGKQSCDRHGGSKPCIPTRRTGAPSDEIDDGEVDDFLRLLDCEGLSRVFEDDATVVDGRVVPRPLLTVDRRTIHYRAIGALYGAKRFERPWDPSKRKPDIALAFDFALLATWQTRKWTYRVCDDMFSRLPPIHRYFPFGGKRPGWRITTRTLVLRDLMHRSKGQTWLLTPAGEQVASGVLSTAWLQAAVKDDS
ncbi:MAG: hypothetical protein AAF108_09680 [Planctomycetota bacterium]